MIRLPFVARLGIPDPSARLRYGFDDPEHSMGIDPRVVAIAPLNLLPVAANRATARHSDSGVDVFSA